jgi:beta-catenin-like protein 1
MPQCTSCKGFGATLPLRAGICGHCERTMGCAKTNTNNHAERVTSSTSTSTSVFSASGVTVDHIGGLKRARTAETLSADEIRAIIEAGADEVVPALDSTGVKRMLLTLERAVTKNSSLRARHADDAMKFLDSEVEVDRALKALQALAAAPDQYVVLIDSETLRATLPGLLAHENVDIAIDVIELLKELLDDDVAGASPEAGVAANALLDALASADLLEAAMENLTRLSSPSSSAAAAVDNTQQDTSGILACFELVETILALQPARASDLCKPKSSSTPAPLLTALFHRVSSKIFDDVKSLAADLLATLVAADPNVVALIGEGTFQKGADGIECLLEAIAVYKRRAPNGADETETIGNLFDVICTCLVSVTQYNNSAKEKKGSKNKMYEDN